MKNMRINKVSYRDQLIQDYSVIIDVRTPSEFLEDHIPNSINYPVLSNKQRGSGLNTPLGLPVVPEEYSIGVPINSSSMGVVGKIFIASW